MDTIAGDSRYAKIENYLHCYDVGDIEIEAHLPSLHETQKGTWPEMAELDATYLNDPFRNPDNMDTRELIDEDYGEWRHKTSLSLPKHFNTDIIAKREYQRAVPKQGKS